MIWSLLQDYSIAVGAPRRIRRKAAMKEGIREACGHVTHKKGFLTVRQQSNSWALISPPDKGLLWHAEEDFPDVQLQIASL